jgi:hypothetical protein
MGNGIRGVLVWAAVTAGGHAASADDKPPTAEIDAMMTKQAAAMIASDDPALTATLAKGGFITTLDYPVPGNTSAPSRIGMGPAKIVFGAKTIGWRGDWGWVIADAKIGFNPHPEMMDPSKPTRAQMPPPVVWHWVALVVREGGAIKTRALFATPTVSDSQLSGYNYVAGLKVLASPSPLVALLAQPVALGKQLGAGPGIAVLGTSSRDRAIGAAAGKKLLAGWAKLGLEVTGPSPTESSHAPFEITVGDVHIAYASMRMRKDVALVGVVIARVIGETTEVLAASYAYLGGE